MEKWRRLFKGYVRIEVRSSSYERFLNLCAARNFLIWDLTPGDGFYEMNISIAQFRELRPLARKCGARIFIRKKCGLPFFLYTNRRRKFLAAGLFFGFSLMLFLSAFVWNIEISGNQARTEDVIFDYLKEEEIYFGTLKKQVDCKALSEALRRQFSDFTWVSAKIRGTSLLIDVKENDMETAKLKEEYPISDLLAGTWGTIEEIVTRKGTPLVKEGDFVKKGEVLVAGEVPIRNDAKEVIGYQYCGADADIRIKTVYTYKDQFPLTYEEKVYSGMEKRGWQLKIGKEALTLKPQRIPFTSYDVLTKEKQFGFSRYFKLPVYFGEISFREYQVEEKKYSERAAISKMKAMIRKNTEKIQEKGVQIFENNVKIETDEMSCTARGTLTLIHNTGTRVERTTVDQ